MGLLRGLDRESGRIARCGGTGPSRGWVYCPILHLVRSESLECVITYHCEDERMD